MHFYDSGYFGMHFFWWFFWILLWVSFFSYATPVPRRHLKRLHGTPLDILQRRLASGEITEQEYESRKLKIDRDAMTNSTHSKPSNIVTNKPFRT